MAHEARAGREKLGREQVVLEAKAAVGNQRGGWMAYTGKIAREKLQRDALMRGILAAVVVWFVFSMASEDIVCSAAAALLAAAATYLLWLRLPKIIAARGDAEIEAELPFALMAMAVELNMNRPFEKCMEGISKGYGKLSIGIAAAIRKIRGSGASVQEALFEFAEGTESQIVKRAVAQMVAAYEHGARSSAGEPIKRIAREQFAKQRAVAKEFSGKLVMLSLVFIAVSAIVPSLFLAYMVVGSTFMELDFTAWEVAAIATLGFPAVDAAVLLAIRAKTPVFLRGG